MDPLTAITLVTGAIETAIKVAPIAIEGIDNLKTFGVALYEKYTGKVATEEEKVAIWNRIEDLHNRFQAPIPAEEDQ